MQHCMQAGYQTAAVDNLIVTFSRYDLRLVAGLYLGALNSLHKAQLLGITHIVVCPRLQSITVTCRLCLWYFVARHSQLCPYNLIQPAGQPVRS